MSDYEVRDLERRVLGGDRAALRLLRRAWWLMGEPDPEGPWKFVPSGLTITKRPTPTTEPVECLSTRALNAVCRLLHPQFGSDCTAHNTLEKVARLTERELALQKLCGPATLVEIKSVLALAGLKLAEQSTRRQVEPVMARGFPVPPGPGRGVSVLRMSDGITFGVFGLPTDDRNGLLGTEVIYELGQLPRILDQLSREQLFALQFPDGSTLSLTGALVAFRPAPLREGERAPAHIEIRHGTPAVYADAHGRRGPVLAPQNGRG